MANKCSELRRNFENKFPNSEVYVSFYCADGKVIVDGCCTAEELRYLISLIEEADRQLVASN